MPRKLKSIPTIRKAAALDIRITYVNSGIYAKQKNCVERAVPINPLINVAYVLSVHCTVRILQKMFVLSKINHPIVTWYIYRWKF